MVRDPAPGITARWVFEGSMDDNTRAQGGSDPHSREYRAVRGLRLWRVFISNAEIAGDEIAG
jgi:hypothetical protein